MIDPVGQEPPIASRPASEPAAEPFLIAAGIVFNWLGNGLAAIFLAFAAIKAFEAPFGGEGPSTALAIAFAALSWLGGKVLRHLLCHGRSR